MQTHGIAQTGRPTLRVLEGGQSPSTWRQEAEAMYDVAETMRVIADSLPDDSETREHLAKIAEDYNFLAAVRGVTGDDDRESCRDAAAREMVRGCERALARVHPDDHEEREWYAARLRETRGIAGLRPVALVMS
jgi:hypothetical protein